MTDIPTAVVGSFQQHQDAERAVEELRGAGFTDSQVGIIHKGEDGTEGTAGTEGAAESEPDHGKGAGAGIATGAIEGGLLGALAAFVIPGVGPVIGAGILGTTILGALTGGATGGIFGALTGMGIHKDEAEHYNREFESGRSLVTVRADGREAEAREILANAGAAPMEGGQAYNAGQTMQFAEEQVTHTREQVSAGEVHVVKDVVTEQRTTEVPVKREEVVVERHAVENAQPAEPIGAEEVTVPVYREEAYAEKTPVVREEVSVGKRQVEGVQAVTTEVKHEEPRLENAGDLEHQG